MTEQTNESATEPETKPDPENKWMIRIADGYDLRDNNGALIYQCNTMKQGAMDHAGALRLIIQHRIALIKCAKAMDEVVKGKNPKAAEVLWDARKAAEDCLRIPMNNEKSNANQKPDAEGAGVKPPVPKITE